MTSVTHYLKMWTPFFEQALSGVKMFELRRDDRHFKVGDFLVLMEYDTGKACLTGRTLRREVICVLSGFEGLEDGFCILGLK